MRMPTIVKCECGEMFDIDRAKMCKKCKSHYCDECRGEGDLCIYCKQKSQSEKIMKTTKQILKELKTRGWDNAEQVDKYFEECLADRDKEITRLKKLLKLKKL